jgi:HNH endonuclease
VGKRISRPVDVDPVTWFWAGFQRNESGCLEWQHGCTAAGYGLGAADVIKGVRYAHRIAWTLTNGPIPDGLCVLHRCDNPPCADPDHLFLGTRADNMHDKTAKGRQGAHRAPRPWLAKLTGAQVLGVLLRLDGGETQQAIATRYGVSRGNIRDIATGMTWSHYSL